MDACAMAVSIQPQTKPPCATPPEWHICGPTSYSITARPGSVLAMATWPSTVWRVGAIASDIGAPAGRGAQGGAAAPAAKPVCGPESQPAQDATSQGPRLRPRMFLLR